MGADAAVGIQDVVTKSAKTISACAIIQRSDREVAGPPGIPRSCYDRGTRRENASTTLIPRLPRWIRRKRSRGRLEVIRRWGPWIGYNIRLADGVYTIGPDLAGAAERRVAAVAQTVTDLRGGSLDGVRVLDLGSHEGGFGIEMASRGATVVCVEARDAHVAKSRFVKDCLGLGALEIVQQDVRAIDPKELGTFDVVLCLGLLYHLPADDLAPFVRMLATLSTGFAVIETQISLRSARTFEADGHRYAGRLYTEDESHAGAAVDGRDSFWLTRPSLLNILDASGFTSVVELLNPLVIDMAAFEDHLTFIALRGERSTPRVIPDVSPQLWPERLSRQCHPTQARFGRWPILTRFAHRRLQKVIRGRERTR